MLFAKDAVKATDYAIHAQPQGDYGMLYVHKREKDIQKGYDQLMQAYNPYLPSYEYVPDGEPYVFEDRVYVYGSHDRFNAPIFCMNDYICWSAPVDQLAAWRYEGVIYRKNQDPMNKLGIRLLFAPDVVQGSDGRFYLYYAFDFMGVMGVAVCDTPAGAYQFHGHIKYPNGQIWGSKRGDELPFDPGVLVDDDGRVYLYSGFAKKIPFVMSRGRDLKNSGCVVLELEQDMVTIKSGPQLLLPKRGNNPPADFAQHEFFEASSMRKIDGKYYLVYSSANNHELCYAVSNSPTEGFRFGGTLLSIGDLFLDGNTDEKRAKNYLGNTHGGMLCLEDQWYIFYHRQTNQHSYSRQACAEPLQRTADGRFLQAEITSCGLNGGPLAGKGEYPAHIACNLWSSEGTARYDKRFNKKAHPYFTQNGKDGDQNATQYIANLRNGSVAGFKYFDMQQAENIRVAVAGHGDGYMQVACTPDFSHLIAELPVSVEGSVNNVQGPLEPLTGTKPLYFRYYGQGYIDFYAFELI